MAMHIHGAGQSIPQTYTQVSNQPSRSDRSQETVDRVSLNREAPQKQASAEQRGPDRVTIREEARQIQELTARDREVRTHEAAHAAAGGRYAGTPSLSYEQGPNGKSYAVEGEVSIDVSKVSGDSQATLQKAETIRSAALAPAQPSSADRAIAAKATRMAAQARADIAEEQGKAASEAMAKTFESRDADAAKSAPPPNNSPEFIAIGQFISAYG